VRGYPLVVSVGIDTDVALARYFTNRTAQVALGATVTALISAVLATYLRHDGHLRRTRDDLQARYTEKSGLLETTLENISQGIMMVGPDDHVQIYNRRYLQKFGLPEDFMAAKPLVAEVARWLWDHGEYDGQGGTFEAWLRRFTESLRDEFQVVQHVRPNGVVLEIHSRVLPDGGVVRTYSDITALRAATDAAQESNRAKSTFLATMSHEIRSPLSGMMGVLDLLRTTALDSEQTGMANMVHDSAQMLLAVLNDVLDFSKIDAGALSIVPEPTALRTLLDDLVQPYVVTGRNKGIDVSLSIAIMTDALRLHQIVGNLLSNAMKFTPAGQVAVRVELTDDQTPWLRVLVRDSGIGMDVDTLARLFRPFVQADGSTTRKYGGSGLGLCICEQLTRLLGGRLSVTSRPGAGSEFLLELPVSACAAPPDAASETAAAGPAIRAGGRVLLVDDDPTNRWLGRRRLEQSGLDVDIAEDGQAGLEAALATSYDLIVTDLHMPRLDGVGLAHAVRAAADPALRGIPIVALSADTTAVQRKRCDDAGITEVAIKPLTTPALLALLARVLPRGEAAIAMAAAPVMVADDLENVPFDPQIYLSFMAPGDPEGAAWLGEYLAGAQDDVDELGAMLADQGADRVSVARVAHRLAGASFSAGAMTVGRAARSVELAAPDAEAVTLRERHAELCAALAAASCAIEAFRTQTEA
jgi:two-component system sensor histidine kinase EvgS